MPRQNEEELKLETRLKKLSDDITTASRNPNMSDEAYQEQIRTFMKERNLAIEAYMKSKGWEVQGELLLTRHPESKGKQKMYGLSPDATPSEQGVASLSPTKKDQKKHANNYMHLLLRDPQKPISFARSNMIRAGLLCNMIMQSVISNGVKVTTCINSSDFQETQGKVTAASTTPIPEKPEQLAKWRNKNKTLSSAREELSQLVNAESRQIVMDQGGSYDGSKSAGISEDPINARLDSIDALLTNKGQTQKAEQKTSVTWLVGHGKTSSNFFKKTFGKKYSFDFSTTKSIYLVEDKKGNLFYFSPPGAIKINNQGKLEGVFHKKEHLLLSPQDAPQKEIREKKGNRYVNAIAGRIAKKISSTAHMLKLTKEQISQTQGYSTEVKERLEKSTNKQREKQIEIEITEMKSKAQTAIAENKEPENKEPQNKEPVKTSPSLKKP